MLAAALMTVVAVVGIAADDRSRQRPTRHDRSRQRPTATDGRRRMRRGAKAIGLGVGIEASPIRETRIALHNFRLASRPAELQLLSSSALPVEFCRLTLTSSPRHRRSHSLFKGEFRSGRILKGSRLGTAPRSRP